MIIKLIIIGKIISINIIDFYLKIYYHNKMNQNIKETYYGKKIDTSNILNIEDASRLINNRKTIVVTGVTGQDGSHMVDFLLKNTDYLIFGGVRRLSVYNHENIRHIKSDRFHLINFDLTDSHAISRTVEKLQPDYFINFAAQSFVASSWDFSKQTWHTNSTAVLDILEAIRLYKPSCRLYQAGSSEEFGNVEYSPQDENHPLKPRSPYGASKAASRQLVKVYRESYGIYAIQGWLFNHEGTRRGEEFVTRKISKNVARIYNAIKNNEDFQPLELGNIEAKRDWSDAEDFIEGVWMMLNQDKYNPNYSGEPKEYIFSSNETHTIKEFAEKAFKYASINGEWIGEGEHIIFINKDKKVLLQINSKFYRPAEVELLLGDSNKARQELNWKPKISFDKLIEKMVNWDIENLKS
jgi:GDPmannose 4,6-dehydratase